MDQEKNTIDMRRLWRAVKQCKWIYLAVIIIFTGTGIWISVRSLPKYSITGQVLIGESDQDSRGGGLSQMMKTFSVGGFSASTVDNEILVLDSHDVMLRTVRALNLNRSYVGKNAAGKKAMLYQDMPVRVEAPAEYFDTLSTAFSIKIKLLAGNKVDIKVTEGFFNSTIKEVKGVTLPYMLETPYGTLQVIPTDLFGSTPYSELTVSVKGNEIAATVLNESVEVELASKLADIIDVRLDYPNAELGKAIVNGIMAEYNAKRLERLHETSVSSVKYYDDRIAETFKGLQAAEKEISEFQKKYDLTGVEAELELLVEEAITGNTTIQTANHNIVYYENVLDILRTRLDDDVVIPQMESLNDPSIGAFNDAILARRELRRSATDDNDALIRLNKRIEELRALIIENSTKMIAKAKSDVQLQQGLTGEAISRLKKYPNFQLEYLSLASDKEFQNQLYLYLMSQRENAVLQLYSSNDSGFVFQPAYVVKKAGLLRKLLWPVALFCFSIFAVTCLAVLLMLITRKVNDTMDLAFIGIDSNAVKGTEDLDVKRFRTKIMADESRRILYFAALTDSAGSYMPMLKESLASAGRSVEEISGLSNNDEVLTTELQSQIETSLKTADYVIVNIPQPEQVATLENVIDRPGAALVIALEAKKISRKKLKSILKGQSIDKVFSAIV